MIIPNFYRELSLSGLINVLYQYHTLKSYCVAKVPDTAFAGQLQASISNLVDLLGEANPLRALLSSQLVFVDPLLS